MNKKTNLEHYKTELKKIFITDGAHPVSVASKIANKLDKNMRLRTCNNYYIEDILDWMAQPYEESVLDDVEKAYLSNIITPFGDRVKYIYLTTQLDGYVYIVICVKSIKQKIGAEVIKLPLFEKGTMYKGMVIERHYSLKELGL